MRWPLMVLLVLTLLTPLKASKKLEIKDQKILNSIENNLIRLFGFSKRPRPNRKDIVIPKAMIELYKQQTGMDVDTTNFMLPGRLTASANTVRSFTHQESSVDDHFQNNHRFRLFFDITIPKSERLKTAELHLSREAMENLNGHEAQILVQDIVSPGIKNKRQPILRLIDSQRVLLHENDTVRLDVTPAVERWHTDPRGNHGILVAVVTPKTISEKKILQKENLWSERIGKHIRLKRQINLEISDWKSVEPVLFVFTDDNKYKQKSNAKTLISRSKRAVRKNKRKDGREHCRRHDLYVDFANVGWNDWIVAPPGYDAYYCSGDCPFPLSDHFNSTNHAIVQTLVNSVFPNTAPKACCVPTALAPISMLYVDEESKVVLKNYQDMSIVGCGCR